jgi:hypothetical protein
MIHADIHRERELHERGLEARVTTVEGRPDLVSVIVSVDELDRYLEGEPDHDGCYTEYDLDDAEETGREEGYEAGYDAAISDIKALAANKATETAS